MESLYHRHREDHEAVLVGLKIAKEGVGDVPDHSGFFLNVDTHLGDFIVAHKCSPAPNLSLFVLL